MQRLAWLIGLVFLGLGLIGFSLLVPAHLRAVDAAVIEQAGLRTGSLVEEGLKQASLEALGPARRLWQAAQATQIPGQENLEQGLQLMTRRRPGLAIWGGPDVFLEALFEADRELVRTNSQPIMQVLLRRHCRERVLAFLTQLPRPELGELLKCRALAKTVYFPPVSSSAGQALESVIALTGLLVQGHHLTPNLTEEIAKLIAEANRTGDSQKLERLFLDLLSLGERLNWAELRAFVSRVDDTQTLGGLALFARTNEAQLPVLFAAVEWSGRPQAVAGYLVRFKETGLKDLELGLRAGAGGLDTLLQRQQRVYYPGLRNWIVSYDPFGAFFFGILGWCRRWTGAALGLKYCCFLLGGFCLARSYRYWRPVVSALERPLQVPELAPARQGLWALFFLLVLIFLSEPFLAQESQQVGLPLKLPLPKVGRAAPMAIKKTTDPLMKQLSIISLVLFFVLQALVYTACLLKLAEIRRQTVGPRLKLKLLENEEHLFDAGLYLGFVGTIISLILMSMGVVKPSLMAGYSSTSFGIIFVSVLKIFHIRPLRRKLILESESLPA